MSRKNNCSSPTGAAFARLLFSCRKFLLRGAGTSRMALAAALTALLSSTLRSTRNEGIEFSFDGLLLVDEFLDPQKFAFHVVSPRFP